MKHFDPGFRRPQAEKRVEIVIIQTPYRGALQFQQVRLARIDVHRKNRARILQQETHGVTAARTDGDHGVTRLDLQSAPIRGGIFPTHPEE